MGRSISVFSGPLNLTGADNPDDDKETDPADDPVEVLGAFLTEVRYGDTRPMSYADVRQGQQDSCIFAAVLSATALSSFNLESGIREISHNGSVITYGVRLYQNSSGTLSVIEKQVVFDGTFRSTDYIPRNKQDYWPAIYQRAYIDYANSINANYKNPNFAFETLIGASTTTSDLANTAAQAQQIKAALVSGEATIAGTKDSSNKILENKYGLISSHGYTVLGVTIPASGDLGTTIVTVRNPWARDTDPIFFDANHDGSVENAEFVAYAAGVDGANDGIIKLSWGTFAANFTIWTHTNRTGSNINNIVKVDLPVVYSNPVISNRTVYGGQRLEFDIKATDPEGKFVFYSMVSRNGYINAQSGKFSWEPPASIEGYEFITVRAETNPNDARDITFLVNVISGNPKIGSLTASPTTIKDDGSDLLTLTPSNVSTPIGSINDIQYWRDADGDGALDKSKDIWLGYGGQFYVGGLTPGKQKFFAQARRFSFSDEFLSFPKSVTVDVVAAPKPPAIAIPKANQVLISPSGQSVSARKTVVAPGGQSSYLVCTDRIVRQIDNNGAVLQTFQIAEPNALNIDIAVTSDSYDGSFVAVWMAGTTMKSRWYNRGTSGIETLATGISMSDNCLKVATDYSGNYLIVWHQGDYLEEDVWAMSVANDGNFDHVVRAPWKVSATATGAQKYPTVSIEPSGDGIIAWTDWQDFQHSKITARRVTHFGQQNGPEIVVTNTGGTVDLPISSAIRRDVSDAYITWTVGGNVFVQRVAIDGRLLGSPIKANTFAGGYASSPSVAVNGEGWFTVGWTNSVQDGNANDFRGVYAQVFTPGGVKAGPEFAVPNDTTGSQGLSGLTLNRQGNLVVVWSDGSVKARVFTVDFPPVILSGQVFPVLKNTVAGTVIGKVVASDANDSQVLTWELLDSPGFAISQTGDLSVTVPPAFSSGSTYTVKVRVTTNGKSVDQTVTISKSLAVDLKATLLQPNHVRQIGTQFGAAVVADSNYYVVGAPNTKFQNAEGRVFVHDTTGTLIRTIENPEPTAASQFGNSLAISGSRILVSARELTNSNPIAYVFDLANGNLISAIHFNDSTGTPSISGDLIVVPREQWRQVSVYSATSGALLRTIDDPSNASFSTRFGASTAISGNTIAVGLPRYVESGVGVGKIFLFDATTGALVRTLNQPQISNYESFGTTMAVTGNSLLVGDYYATVGSISDAGAVHVFDLSTGSLLKTITNPAPVQNGHFGNSLAALGTTAVVGSDTNYSGDSYVIDLSTGNLINTFSNPNARHLFSPAIGSGRVLLGVPDFSLGAADERTGAVFVYDTSTKQLKNILFNPTFASGDHLGSSVATSETRVVVGAPGSDQIGPDSGRAMVYDSKTGSQLFTLDPTLGPGALFGTSVATSVNYVAVSAPGYNGERIGGSVLIYDGSTGALLRIISNPSTTYDSFGQTIALFENKLVVGAPFSDIGAEDSGVAYEFDVSTGDLLATINNPSPAANDNFGSSVAISENAVVVGAKYDDSSGSNSGEVYVFSVVSGLLIRTLSNPSPAAFDQFGETLTAFGSYIAVGAPGRAIARRIRVWSNHCNVIRIVKRGVLFSRFLTKERRDADGACWYCLQTL